MKKKKIVVLVALALLTLGLAGGATLVFASNTPNSDVGEEDPAIDASTVALSEDQAQQAVLAQYPGATIGEIQLEDENGTIVFGIQITFEGLAYDVKVDANTGAVLSADTDDQTQEEESDPSQETDAEDQEAENED